METLLTLSASNPYPFGHPLHCKIAEWNYSLIEPWVASVNAHCAMYDNAECSDEVEEILGILFDYILEYGCMPTWETKYIASFAV